MSDAIAKYKNVDELSSATDVTGSVPFEVLAFDVAATLVAVFVVVAAVAVFVDVTVAIVAVAVLVVVLVDCGVVVT